MTFFTRSFCNVNERVRKVAWEVNFHVQGRIGVDEVVEKGVDFDVIFLNLRN